MLVAKSLQFSGGHQKIGSQIAHVAVREVFLKQFEVVCMHCPGVFPDLPEIREGAPLTHFVRHEGNGDGVDLTGKVGIGFGAGAPSQATDPGPDVVLVANLPGPAASHRSTGIHPPGIAVLPEPHEICHVRYSSFGLIPCRHHAERGVIAIVFLHAHALVV